MVILWAKRMTSSSSVETQASSKRLAQNIPRLLSCDKLKLIMSLIHELLIVREEDKQRVRRAFGKTEEDIQQDLSILLKWLKKQTHLPKDHEKIRLEACLLRNKFRIEQTKTKLDMYYTYRGIYSNFFLDVDPVSTAIKYFRKAVLWVPMPQLPPTMERVTVIKFHEKQEDFFNLNDLFTYALIMLDLQLTHDYAVGERYVIDASNMSMKYLLKMTPGTLAKGIFLTEQAFSGRLVAVNYFNLPSTWDYILGLLKQSLKGKLFEKINTCRTLDSLYETVPRKYLPKDYGGEQESLAVLHEKWGEELMLQREFLLARAQEVSDEKLRIGDSVHTELFGIDGTFRKINID